MRRLRVVGRRNRRPDEEPNVPPEPWLDEEDTSSLEGPDNTTSEAFEPFVPVPARPGYAEEDAEDIARISRRRRRLAPPSLPRPRSPRVGIRPGALFLVLALIAAGVFGVLLKQDRLEADVVEWWPVAILAGAGLWMLVALIQRRIAPFLGGAAAAGVGLSLLMDSQGIAEAEQTLLGVVLAAVGLGIVIRGFLLRQQSPV